MQLLSKQGVKEASMLGGFDDVKDVHISGEGEGEAVIEQVFQSFPFKPIHPSQTRWASLLLHSVSSKLPLLVNGENWIAKLSITCM